MNYLELPGFQSEETPPLGQRDSRIAQLAKTLAPAESQTSPKPKLYKFQSDNIDDRISWIEFEINVGKRDQAIRRIAAQVVKSVPPRQWDKSAVALFEWTRKNIRYTLDPLGVELFQKASRSLDIGIGDCDDQTIVLGSLLGCVGIPVRLRVIGLKGSDKFQHIYILVGLPPNQPTAWTPLDPSRPEKAGWELPESQRGLLQDYEVDDFDPEE